MAKGKRNKAPGKRRATLMLSMLLLSGGLMTAGPAEADSPSGRQITAYTEVTKWGQMPLRFTVRGQNLSEDIGAEFFSIAGDAAAWGTASTHSFSCGVKEVIPEADGWSLVPDPFPDKYFYVRRLTVSCEADPALGFTLADIGQTVTETADLFTLWESENRMIHAQVYQPETVEPLPVVVVFHGYGDTANLLTYRTAVDWAEPAHQASRPCTVIAPVIDDGMYIGDSTRSKIFTQVLSWIDGMIQAGTADPDRIYLMGNSFGGMSAIEMAEQHPDRIAAVMALCPALNYSRTGMASLPKMVSVPLYIAQAEKDETIPSSVGMQAAEQLRAAGGDVTLKIYSDAEMEAAGAVLGSENTYSFHHVELALLENQDYAEWLFSHRLAQAEPDAQP
ncbi:MAG: alpha/beta fold hydrolase [Clostridia bacterium]|nr:alpha/beta fold hydrolase [Clostridia bacterium]